MASPPISEDIARLSVEVLDRLDGNKSAAARELGISRAALDNRLLSAKANYGYEPGRTERSFRVQELPEEDLPIEEVLARREKEFKRRIVAEDARKLISVSMSIRGPFGVAIFGDLHIDSPGCNIPLLRAHTQLVKETEGLFAGAVGDLQDNWIGRLARLWAEQGVTARDSYRMTEWWLAELSQKLLFVVDGNHDGWGRGVSGIGPLDWICKQYNLLNQSDGIRIALQAPGVEKVTINCRHDFKGRSQYNPAHGPTKAVLFGWRDDIAVAGHTHESGYNVHKDPMTGKVSHALRIASYKYIDRYAKTEGFPDNNIFECPVALVDPDAKDPRYRVKIMFDPFEAAEYLTWKRQRWAA